MSESMIEHVARAICEAEKMNPDDVLGGWVHWQEAARAAIEAMREPTETMTEAGAEQLYGHPRSKAEEWGKADKFESWAFDATRTFGAMIDAALNDNSPIQP